MDYMRSPSLYEREETFHSISVESNEESRGVIASLKKEILNYLENDVILTMSYYTKINGSVLGLEVIRLCKMMIEFGMFGRISGTSNSEFNRLIKALFIIPENEDIRSNGSSIVAN